MRALPPTQRFQASLTGGASSLLRLSNAAAPRLPKAPALADWVQRAASVLGLKQEGPAFAASEFR